LWRLLKLGYHGHHRFYPAAPTVPSTAGTQHDSVFKEPYISARRHRTREHDCTSRSKLYTPNTLQARRKRVAVELFSCTRNIPCRESGEKQSFTVACHCRLPSGTEEKEHGIFGRCFQDV